MLLKNLARLLAVALAATLVLAATSSAHAQNCPADKTCYYVPPQMPIPSGYSVGWDLVLSAGTTAVTGSYTIAGQATVPFNATPGTPLLVVLDTTKSVASGYAVKEQRGIFVVADQAGLSVATRERSGPWNNSATIKDHNTALGTRFRVGGYTLDYTQAADTGHDMIAFYAPLGATVTVAPPPGGVTWGDSLGTGTLTITLSAQQTYLLRTKAQGCGFDMTGALVTSDQPIAIMSGGRGWGVSGGACSSSTGSDATGCGDDGFDNLIPTTGIGTRYAVDAYPAQDGDRVTVVADQDGTQVRLNGSSTVVATLNAGQKYRASPTALTLIETSKPAYVFQDAGLLGCEHGFGIIPPLTFSSSTQTSSISVAVWGLGAISVILPTSRVSTILVDGAAPTGTTVTAVPGEPSISRVRFSVSGNLSASTNHTVTATGDFQLGLVSNAVGGTGLFAFYNRFRVEGCGDGIPQPGEACEDGNVVDGDGCSGACRVEIGYPCDNDAACVANGRCDPGLGECVARCLTNADCNDGSPCTNDVCNLGAGICANTPANVGGACNDGQFCSATSACDETGHCVATSDVSCAEPGWSTCAVAACNEATDACGTTSVTCDPARTYFYGVVKTSPTTYGSIRCWRDSAGVDCEQDGGELVVGKPVCE